MILRSSPALTEIPSSQHGQGNVSRSSSLVAKVGTIRSLEDAIVCLAVPKRDAHLDGLEILCQVASHNAFVLLMNLSRWWCSEERVRDGFHQNYQKTAVADLEFMGGFATGLKATA